MERLIAEMYRCKFKEYEYSANNMPFDIIIAMENISALMIRPEIYSEYCLNLKRFYGYHAQISKKKHSSI